MTQQEPELARLEVRKLRKVFGRHAALAGVDATFEHSAVTLLMGPNGAGKSTLLSILATTSRPTSGEVRYGASDHALTPDLFRHRIGLLTHAPLLYLDLSARENLRFFARLYGLVNAHEWVESWLDHVALQSAATRPIRLLSHGMKQRVALGRALMHNPALLLLDEPFTGLDRDGVALLRKEISRAKEANKVVVIVTHDVEAVDGLCDQLVVLRRGRTGSVLHNKSMNAAEILEHYHGVV
ncbi:MAG: ABC transporter ATP-binding protein [Deltaproteobacteria bacterium]|nr:ABC transporter ATP-binding protein [Deltaproteobacteria bacterium]